MNKKCILTFDYELFFNKSGTAQYSIIGATERLIACLDRFEIKATFFVDVLYLKCLLETDEITKAIYKKIEEQLQSLVSNGHRIELHVHPHWIDAVWIKDSQTWEFPSYEHYKISSLESDEIENMINKGVIILNRIARKVNPNYSVIAFRAGGWCVEPFNIIKNYLSNNGIVIDSSVAPGTMLNGDVHQLDYSDIVPSEMYQFDSDVRIPVNGGLFTELPVNSYCLNLFEKIHQYFIRKCNRKDSTIFGDGSGMKAVKEMNIVSKCFFLFMKGQSQMYSIDGWVGKKMLFKKIMSNKFKITTIVGHPKTLTQSSLNSIVYLFSKKIDFVTVENVLRNIK